MKQTTSGFPFSAQSKAGRYVNWHQGNIYLIEEQFKPIDELIAKVTETAQGSICNNLTIRQAKEALEKKALGNNLSMKPATNIR
jgi:hypothetical protein